MKQLITFYILILLPLFFIFYIIPKLGLGSTWFLVALSIYCLIYRPVVDYQRLKGRGIVRESFWKLYIPLFRFRYFKELYTGF